MQNNIPSSRSSANMDLSRMLPFPSAVCWAFSSSSSVISPHARFIARSVRARFVGRNDREGKMTVRAYIILLSGDSSVLFRSSKTSKITERLPSSEWKSCEKPAMPMVSSLHGVGERTLSD